MTIENDDEYDYIDPYVMDNGVLKNRFDIKDTKGLNDIEADFTRLAIPKVLEEPIQTNFDTSYLKQLHYKLFSEVYDWAGEFRTIGIAKGGTLFLAPEQIESELDKLFSGISKQKDNFKNNKELFSQYVGEMLINLNYIHPFREGNGRTQRLFISRLAQYADIDMEWETISDEAMKAACIDGIEGNTRKMVRLILLNSKINNMKD
jgi:cell filamentation protein